MLLEKSHHFVNTLSLTFVGNNNNNNYIHFQVFVLNLTPVNDIITVRISVTDVLGFCPFVVGIFSRCMAGRYYYYRVNILYNRLDKVCASEHVCIV